MIYKDFRHLEIVFFGSDIVGEGTEYKSMALLVQEIQYISASRTLTL